MEKYPYPRPALQDHSDRQSIDDQFTLLEDSIKESKELLKEFEDETNDLTDTSVDINNSELLINARSRVLNKKESSDLYHKSIYLAKDINDRVENNEILECGSINFCVDKFVEQLILDNKFLPVLMSGLSEDYLSSHAVNVCILSIKIGIGLGYDKTKLTELGISAFLHDIGMTKYMELASKQRKLTIEEYEIIKRHPVMSAAILQKAMNLPETAIQVTLQQHERIDGSDYPHGLKGESISTYARIVNLADTYEALTHTRSYRSEFKPFEAVQKILSMKTSFDYNVMKSFIKKDYLLK